MLLTHKRRERWRASHRSLALAVLHIRINILSNTLSKKFEAI